MTSASYCASIGTERNAIDPKRMPVERTQVFSGINVPQSNGSVPTPASNRMSIRTERDVVYLIPMSVKR